jgi:ligand-binding sensor domain-containing protein
LKRQYVLGLRRSLYNIFSTSMKKIYILTLTLIGIHFCIGQNIVSSLKDKTGNLWFSVSDRGIYRFDGKSFSKFTGQVGEGISISSCIYEDKTGHLWFKTNDGGVCKYDGKTFSSLQLPLPDSNIVGRDKYSTLKRNRIEVGPMLEDKKGKLWFLTTNHGVYRYDADLVNTAGYEKSFTVFAVGVAPVCILESKNGEVLVGSWDGSGMHCYNGKTFTSLPGFSDGMIFCMIKDNAGSIWAGTRIAGADRWDGELEPDGRAKVTNFSDFSKKEGNGSNNIPCIFQDSEGNLWFGTNWNNYGLRGDAFFYDGKTFTNITKNEKTTKFADFSVRSFVEDNNGNIWIGSKNGILLRYDGKAFTDFSQHLLK